MSMSMTGATGMKGASGGGRTGNVVPKGFNQGQLQQFTPEQMNLFQQLFGQVGGDSYLSKLAGGDQSTFEQAEAPALKQFGQLQGQIANRFSNMGSGARRSSGFQNYNNQAASDFAQQLQSNRMNLQRQAIGDLFGMQNTLLQHRPYEQSLFEKPQSFGQQAGVALAGGIGQGLGSIAGKYLPG